LFRKAVIADSIAINSVSKELGYKVQTQEIANDRIKVIIESDIDELFVFEDDEIKGWIHFFIANRVASPPFLEIGGLVVSSEFRRKGIGKQLVNYAIKWAKDRNLKTRVRCNSKRISTHEFYLAIGFSKTKEQHIFEIKQTSPWC